MWDPLKWRPIAVPIGYGLGVAAFLIGVASHSSGLSLVGLCFLAAAIIVSIVFRLALIGTPEVPLRRGVSSIAFRGILVLLVLYAAFGLHA
jgi:hypothetical protein